MTDASEMKNLKSRKLYLQVYDEIKNYIEKVRQIQLNRYEDV